MSDKKEKRALETLEIGKTLYKTQLTTKFKNRKSWQKPDDSKVLAVIPGTIREIMVEEGQQVAVGTPLLILEAMKMRNEVLSPLDGVVKSIHVSTDEQVPKAQLLVQLG